MLQCTKPRQQRNLGKGFIEPQQPGHGRRTQRTPGSPIPVDRPAGYARGALEQEDDTAVNASALFRDAAPGG